MLLSVPVSFVLRGVVSEKPFHDVGRVAPMSTGLTKHYRFRNSVFSKNRSIVADPRASMHTFGAGVEKIGISCGIRSNI